MRKGVLIALVVVILALLAASGALYQRLQKRSADYAALQTEEQEARARYGQAIDEIAAIQDSLNAIILGEDGAQALATELDAEKSLSRDRSEEVKARIAVLKAGVQRAKDRIKELEANLRESGVKIAGLEKLVRNLRQTVAEKEELIVQLTQRVDELQTQVTGLKVEVAHKQETIEAQTVTIEAQAGAIEETRRELGTIYYTIGSKKELKDAGVIVAQGGFLGIGRTLKPSGQIDETRFTPLDTDRETVIRIPADEAKILSAQPVTSYELQRTGDQMELRILDPKAFRTIKYVIIMVS